MMRMRHNLRRALTMISAVLCIVLAFLWPNWREELRGQYSYKYTYTVGAGSPGLTGSPLSFNITGLTPATIAAVSGNNLSATAGTALPNPFVVVVTDASNNPVPGVPVTFAVASGGGTLSAASVVTNTQGLAPTLLLGVTAGTNTVTATAAGVKVGVTFTATGH